jgi:hypothetical protein
MDTEQHNDTTRRMEMLEEALLPKQNEIRTDERHSGPHAKTRLFVSALSSGEKELTRFLPGSVLPTTHIWGLLPYEKTHLESNISNRIGRSDMLTRLPCSFAKRKPSDRVLRRE